MDSFVVLIVAPDTHSNLFEQIVLHAGEDTNVITAKNEIELGQLLSTTPVNCLIVDWETDYISADLFPRLLRRIGHGHSIFIIAIVHDNQQLHAAYTAGYDLAFKIEFVRSTYYLVRSVLKILCNNARLERIVHELEGRYSDLEQRTEQFVCIIERLQARRIPEYTAVVQFARPAVQWILNRLEVNLNAKTTDQHQLDLAVRFYAIGRVVLEGVYLYAPIHTDGIPTSTVAATVPTIASELLDHLADYPQTRLILLTMYENFDGTGFPHRSQGWHIPLGARILRTVVDYAEMLFRDGIRSVDALSIIQQQSRRLYDQRVVLLLEEYVTCNDFPESNDMVPLRVESLSAGMVLGRDIVTMSGHKLAARGTQLSPEQVEQILAHTATDPVMGRIYVLRSL
ncbi:MAG: hypothetical protein N2663_08230 [Chlorobi bacterium]|nr:hypothetical protein [Chlorobiota bacterium]